jgi:hypothetical protein
MTKDSAQRYDTQVEVLFKGTANATRRQALPRFTRFSPGAIGERDGVGSNATPPRAGHPEITPQRLDCLAGVRGLELRNVEPNYPLEPD